MQAAASGYYLFFMAVNAYRGITVTWSGYQICMSFIFMIGGIDTPMTFYTGDFAVVGLRKSFSVDQNFLPWLQRSHSATSTHA
jgi:hypothetical protein